MFGETILVRSDTKFYLLGHFYLNIWISLIEFYAIYSE